MRRYAHCLLVGAASAAVLWPALTLAQVSYRPTDVNNRQTRTGDAIADGDLDVIDPDTVTSTRVATGNGYTATVANGSLNVDSQQLTQGDVKADQKVHVQDYAGQVSAVSAATGNTGEANSLNYGDVNADVTQTMSNHNVTAHVNLDGPIAEITDATVSSQATANSHGFTTIGGAHDISADQYSNAVTQATTEAQVRYSQGTTNFNALATSNNVTAYGQDGAEPKYYFKQQMQGDRTQASVLVGARSMQELNGTATAVSNNISITNEYHPLDVTTDQNNASYVRAESDVNITAFGAASSNAYGVGNSVVAGNNAADISIDNNQQNDGAVVSSARFSADNGYDASVSSTAMGNAITGYTCSSCDSTVGVYNRQSSSNLVSASAGTTMTGHNRSVVSNATAIGNSATFYNSTPGS